VDEVKEFFAPGAREPRGQPDFVLRRHHRPSVHPSAGFYLIMSDLETYQVQLEQVQIALQADPDNAELVSLEKELQELIDLTRLAAEQSSSTSAPSTSSAPTKPKAQNAYSTYSATPAHTWAAGNECLAKYSGDGQWYPARIVSIGGAADKPVYVVSFRGYDSTELLDAASLKPLPANYGSSSSASATYAPGAKRKLTKEEEEEKERKKKKNEKKLEVRAQKAKEQASKQHTWQKFAKKSEKKGIHIAGTSGTSIFKTPDNPYGKGESWYARWRTQH
jgi:survival of motor neuron-related-splicing factor 30